jgi:hypothetical protein
MRLQITTPYFKKYTVNEDGSITTGDLQPSGKVRNENKKING